MSRTPSLHVIDVSARDGLQIEAAMPTADQKLALIEGLVDAGVREIEVGSFVNPRAVPQMADTPEVVERLPARSGVTYRALWLNLKGLDRALSFPQLSIDGRLTVTASETFSRRNTNRGIEEALADMPAWMDRYDRAGIKSRRLSVMAAFGCNFEGRIDPVHFIGLIARAEAQVRDHGDRLDFLTLADTMGWASPHQVRQLIGLVRERWPELMIRLHLHDTRACAVANAIAAMELGVNEFDAAVGGLGGCPFAAHQGAAGNLCTEDLVFACQEMGWETGIDLDALIEVARAAQRLVGHELPGKLMKGGSLTRFGQSPVGEQV